LQLPLFLIVDGKRSISLGICDIHHHQLPKSSKDHQVNASSTHRRTNVPQDAHELSGQRFLVALASEEGDSLPALSSSTSSTTSVDKVLCKR
jgi:hypothetical protein